ncbi:substrate-binding domain-containing protein [Streptomyces sp. NPDC044571]|uniref:substrate-binding domain-containing protein n=1 Tax=Streptomyces sp. NPDC044571 TaxID=3155371 RepID=UPI0033C79A61
MLDHLTASGARRTALHSGYGREFYTAAVTSAFARWCVERGLAPLVVPFDPDDAPGHAFDGVFGAPGRPDAVYCVYDPGGRQVPAAAARHGIRTPAELLLVCASEDPAYAEQEPAVTTVTLNPERIAVSAVSALVMLIESGHAEPAGRCTVPAGLRVRASSLRPDMY